MQTREFGILSHATADFDCADAAFSMVWRERAVALTIAKTTTGDEQAFVVDLAGLAVAAAGMLKVGIDGEE